MKFQLTPLFALSGPILLSLSACISSPGQGQLYPGIEGYHRPIRTDSAAAQDLVDQGLALLYGFNHDEAIRSFEAAAEADPECILAWWGIAYANGLHINNTAMSGAKSKRAFETAQKALNLAAGEAGPGAALARAVAARYEWPAPDDRKRLDLAYAAEMEAAWRRYPTDPDIGTLFAESLMNLQPWDLWTPEGEPKGRTLEIVAVLERVMELRPDHPGANHFYIHTVEASLDPDRAVAAADRLVDLVPGAGHLVHMPSHIYVRVGRYAEAADANERAIAADRAYFKQAPQPDFYNVYYVHNLHFLAYAAMMEGRYETAMAAARDLEHDIPAEFLREYVAIADGLMTTPLHVMIRFGKWESILVEPEPESFQLLSRTQRHYARAVALAALGRPAEARDEMAQFESLATQVPSDWVVGNNTSAEVIALARQMMLGEILFREGKLDEAFAALARGVQLEDNLVYDEPPGWMQPIRHAYGALLMSAGRYAQAERIYREDLKRNRQNGWSLVGLEQALAAQGKLQESLEVGAKREMAWSRADVQPSSSCYCEPGGPALSL